MIIQELRSKNGNGGFKESGLFPPKKEIVYKRMLKNHVPDPISTVEAVAFTSAITSQAVEAVSSTLVTTTSQTVRAALQYESSIGSPFKHIKAAIIEILSQTPSIACKKAMKNVKRKRTRMQQRGGEILTPSTSLDRLHTEKVRRENKSAKMSARKQKK